MSQPPSSAPQPQTPGPGVPPSAPSAEGAKVAAIVAAALLAVLLLGVAAFAVFADGDDEVCCAPDPTRTGAVPDPTDEPTEEPTDEPSESLTVPTPPSPPESPDSSAADARGVRTAAQQWIDAVNARDTALAQEVACRGVTANMESLPVEYPPLSLTGDPRITGGTATITSGSTRGKPRYTFIMQLAKQGGRWCIKG